MADPVSIGLTYTEFAAAVGKFLGYGRDSTAWSAEETTEISDAVNRGARSFYYPPVLPNEKTVHVWGFLKPTATINLAEGIELRTIADVTFGGMLGNQMTFVSQTAYAPILIVGEPLLREKRQYADTTGRPQYVAVRPRAHTGEIKQSFELVFWPTPDAVYAVKYRYNAIPYKLDANHTYPFGGVQHSETILAACLAAAERDLDDEVGTHTQDFMTKLAASVSFDRRTTGIPQFGDYGGNTDNAIRPRNPNGVSYNDVYY